MKTFLVLIIISIFQGGIQNPHCPFQVGIQLPAGKYPTKQVLRFIPPFTKEPQCFVDSGEAHLLVNTGAVIIAGKPESLVDIRCREN